MSLIPPIEHKSFVRKQITKTVSALLFLAVLAAGLLMVHRMNSNLDLEDSKEDPGVELAMADTLTLPSGKLNAGAFQSVAVKQNSIRHLHTVPGRIRYDESKHVDVKAPLDGIVKELIVTPGERVESGQLLAVLYSPEIGQARAEILKRQNERDIAQQTLDREVTVSRNLEQLTLMLQKRESIETIEKKFANQSLSSHRQKLLETYARVRLSTELLQKVKPLAESGSISGRTIREREAERQIAEAGFTTALDEATYSARRAKAEAEAKVAEAERQLHLAWQSVETLLGYQEDKNFAHLCHEESLSRLEVRAPFAGSVEYRGFASDERVSRGESLIVLANTESLYVAASIRESDWPAVAIEQGTLVSVMVPALDNRVFDARVCYLGREVQAETNSIPLVASIGNSEGLLRPGMFVRVTLPIGEARDVLSVKPECVVQHENQSFVFIDLKGGTFKRVDVSTGQASDEWVEVTEGLSPGLMVVTQGAFLLKSELLLQGEAE